MKGIQFKWVYLIILALIWGSSFILMKKALIGITPYQLGALRTVLTGLFLFSVGLRSVKGIEKGLWKWLILSGFIGSFFPAFLFAIAQTEIDSSVVSILNSLVPLSTALMGFAVFGFATTKRQMLGIIIGFIGTTLLILKGAALNPSQNYFYAWFVIASTVLYAFNVNIIKHYLQEVKPLHIAVGNYVGIFIPALIVLVWSDFFTEATFNSPNFRDSMMYVVILSLFGTAISKVLFNKLIQMSTPVFASSYTYILPLVAIGWGAMDGEGFSVLQGLAAIIILIGVFLSHKSKT